MYLMATPFSTIMSINKAKNETLKAISGNEKILEGNESKSRQSKSRQNGFDYYSLAW